MADTPSLQRSLAGLTPVSLRGSLVDLPRRVLQRLAKREGIKANIKSDDIIEELSAVWAVGAAPPAAPAPSPLPDNLAANPLFFMAAGTTSEEEAAAIPGPSGVLEPVGRQGGTVARRASGMTAAAAAPAAAVCQGGTRAEGIRQQQVHAAARKVKILKQRQRGGGAGGGQHAASVPLLGKRRASLCGGSADAEERAPKQQRTASRWDGLGASHPVPKSSEAQRPQATAKHAGVPRRRSAGASGPVPKPLAAKPKPAAAKPATAVPKPAAAVPKPVPVNKPSTSTKPVAVAPSSSSAALQPMNRPLPAPALLTERQRRAEEAWAARMRAAAAAKQQ